jgi:hypothetical protein
MKSKLLNITRKHCTCAAISSDVEQFGFHPPSIQAENLDMYMHVIYLKERKTPRHTKNNTANRRTREQAPTPQQTEKNKAKRKTTMQRGKHNGSQKNTTANQRTIDQAKTPQQTEQHKRP